jgi:Peptidase family M28/PA domain
VNHIRAYCEEHIRVTIRTMQRIVAFLCAAVMCACATAQTKEHPRDGEIPDADTRAWWHTTEELSNDGMEGRDTGSAAYQRAAEYVSRRFQQAGLKPAGENGTWFQTVPMHEIDVLPEGTSFVVTRASGETLPLRFLEEITVAPTSVPNSVEGALVFRGYCGKSDVGPDVAGKFVLCFGTQRQGLPTGAERAASVRTAGAAGVITIDDPYFTIEPPRWPIPYARTVTLKQAASAQHLQTDNGKPFLSMRLSATAFAALLKGSEQDADSVLKAGGSKEPLNSFDIPARLAVKVSTSEKEISSPNVIAVLPGSDPKLKEEYIVVAAHLDGYGYGFPVNGDALYNGALDDAAYVALLIQMAEDLSPATHPAIALPAPKRSILFCAFTGEEKGLLGSNWFVAHPTVPLSQIAADINLDQLRPLFPLKILTTMAVDETTLGTTAKDVGAKMGIELRPDREPERALLRRADQYPFLRAGVPAISFVFGFDPGTDAERRYREWYQVRYHRPQDDLTQPVDFQAAAKFNLFFYHLVGAVADAPERPTFLPGSQFKQGK